ncbi:AMP-binding protein [Noviherbaspirillum pedocola]|uniref:AMP-binding protein n=1 Tax=Noviherbaspirillum pedocola TaxID=2801341 RepID=A0A934T3A6_9BURK|nr:AMP-binding protein [Noviherbaspirillum pedocola]MBK4737588.1 AMP-binding protein [Noviherbaspirillum pedocola]
MGQDREATAPVSGEPAIDAADRLLPLLRQFVADTVPGRTVPVTLVASFERDLGLDSLARAELMLRIGRDFGIDLPPHVISETDNALALLPLLGHGNQPVAPGPAIALPAAAIAGAPAAAQTLVEVLEWHAEHDPERVHVLLQTRGGEEALTYRGLLQRAQDMAGGLALHGLQPGQTVALMLPTGVDYLAAFFGVMLAGAIPVPIYPPARIAQLEDHLKRHRHILGNAGASMLISVPEAAQVTRLLQAAAPSLRTVLTPDELAAAHAAPMRLRPRAADTAFLQYTSGSTGDPKGVILAHANLLANIRALGCAADVRVDDVFVSWLPLYHDMGLIGAWFGSLYYGIPLVLMSPLDFLARPVGWLHAIARRGGTISAAPNFAYELCVRHIDDAAMQGLSLDRWRLALNGAEPVSAATLEAFARRFAPFGLRREALTPVYGLAECSVGLAFPPAGRGPVIDCVDAALLASEGNAVAAREGVTARRLVSCGAPLPGHEVRIVDESGRELPERRVGRLEFRGPSASAGYYRNSAATRALFRNGWLDSGDQAYLAQGEIHIVGRVKDVIKRGGRNLYPYDLEDAVGGLPGVRRGCVAAFAAPGAEGAGERLVVVAETRVTDEARRAVLEENIRGAALDIIGSPIDEVVLAPPHSVLKTSSGKIRRLACRDAYLQGRIGRMNPYRMRARLMLQMAAAPMRVAVRRAGMLGYGVYAWLVFTAMALCFGLPIVVLQQPGIGRRIARAGARLLFALCGAPPVVEGLDRLPRQAHLLAVNHASYLDAILLSATLPASQGYAFVAKQEFATRPGIGALLRGLGTVFIERRDAAHSEEGVARMLRALQRGESLVVFPEGTFRREAGLQGFQAGAFAAAAQAMAPVAVAGINGTRAALRSGTWLPRRAPLHLAIGETVFPDGRCWEEAMRLRDVVRAALMPLAGEFDGTAGAASAV